MSADDRIAGPSDDSMLRSGRTIDTCGFCPCAVDAASTTAANPSTTVRITTLEAGIDPDKKIRGLFRLRHRFRDVQPGDAEVEPDSDVRAEGIEAGKGSG
jgi:hypothetical protein